MKELLKVVIDTNIFISALLGSKKCCSVLDAFLEGKFDLVISEEAFDEFINAITRPKIKNFILQRECENLLELVRTDAEWVIPEERISACRDPKDNIVLECAVSGKVDFIITGDRDLLILSPFHNISIITPSKFLKLL